MKHLIQKIDNAIHEEGLEPIQNILHDIPFMNIARSKVATLLSLY